MNKSNIINYKWQNRQNTDKFHIKDKNSINEHKGFKKFSRNIPLNYRKWWDCLSKEEKLNLHKISKTEDKIKIFEKYKNIYPKDIKARRELILDKIINKYEK